VDIAECSKSIFLPDVCDQYRRRRHGDGAERVSKHVCCVVCGINVCIKVAVSFVINVAELCKPTAEFVFCFKS